MARIKDADEGADTKKANQDDFGDFEDFSAQMDERKQSYARNYIPTMDMDQNQ